MALVVMACTGTKGTGEQTAEAAPDTLLSAAVEDGTLWTDGSNCYTARRSGDTIVFEGGNLHEGGAVVYMLLTSDTTLVVKPVTGWRIDDYSMFAMVNSEVKHQRVGGYELLVARDSVGNPIDVLQGINDAALDLLDFNTRIINNVWAGTYQTEAGERYVFTPDGKVQLKLNTITYGYEEDSEGNTQTTLKAEEWITDEHAINKAGTKLYPRSGKFRRKTVDRVAEIFLNARQAFEEPEQPVAKKPAATVVE